MTGRGAWSAFPHRPPTSGPATTCSRPRSRSTSSSRSPRRASSRSTRGAPVPTDRSNLCVRAFEALHPADGLRFEIRSEIPLARGPRLVGGGDRRRADGRRPPVRAGARSRRDLRSRGRAGGPPGQRRRGALRRVRGLPAAPSDGGCPPPVRLEPPAGRRGGAGRPRRGGADRARRGPRCPPRCRSPTRSPTSRPPPSSCSGSSAPTWP